MLYGWSVLWFVRGGDGCGEFAGDFVEFVAQDGVVEYLVVDVVDGEHDVEVLLFEKDVELGFAVLAVAFACETLDAVAVNGVAEFAFGGGD